MERIQPESIAVQYRINGQRWEDFNTLKCRSKCVRKFCGIYFCDLRPWSQKCFPKWRKSYFSSKKTYNYEKKHTKMRYISQNLFCKTYVLEHLIAKSSSTKIYCAMNLFFKVSHILLLYAVSIFIYSIFPGPGYLRSEDGVVWLWYSLVNLYIYIYIYIYYTNNLIYYLFLL